MTMLNFTTLLGRSIFAAWLAGVMALAAVAQGQAQLPTDLPVAAASDGGKLDAPPQLIKRGRGQYPEHLVWSNNYVRGTVTARIWLSDAGVIESVDVKSATHPAFIRATLTQLSASRFAPGRRDGRPVRAAGDFHAFFDVTGPLGGSIGGEVIFIPEKATDLPPGRQYDLSPLLLRFCDLVYPYEALVAKKNGAVRLRVFLDARGLVERTEVVATDAPEFSLAAQAAIETWEFTPAGNRTGPTPSMFYLEQKFISAEHRRPVTESAVLKIIRKTPGKLATPGALDGVPKPLYRVPPQYPRALLAEKPEGEATVEFVIYETGEVAVPRIVSATKPEFGYAAANAIFQWVFTPPRASGKPVCVRTQLSFSFKP